MKQFPLYSPVMLHSPPQPELKEASIFDPRIHCHLFIETKPIIHYLIVHLSLHPRAYTLIATMLWMATNILINVLTFVHLTR